MFYKLEKLIEFPPQEFVQIIAAVPSNCKTLDLRGNYLNLRSKEELTNALQQLPECVEEILIDGNFFGEKNYPYAIELDMPRVQMQEMIQHLIKQLVRNPAFKVFLHALPFRAINLVIGNFQISSFNFLSELLIDEVSRYIYVDKNFLGFFNLSQFKFSFDTTAELREHAIKYCTLYQTFSSICTQHLLTNLSSDLTGQLVDSSEFYLQFFAGLKLNINPQVLLLSPNFTHSYPQEIANFFDDRQIIYFKLTEESRLEQAIQIAKKLNLGQTLILDISSNHHLQLAIKITSQLQPGVRLVLNLSNELETECIKTLVENINYGVVLHLIHGCHFWKTVDVFSKHLAMPIEISCQMAEEEIQAIQERLTYYAAIQFHDLRGMENIIEYCQAIHQDMLQNPDWALPDSITLAHIAIELPSVYNFSLARQLNKPLQILAAPNLALDEVLRVIRFAHTRSQFVVKNLSVQSLQQVIPQLQSGQEIFFRNEIAVNDVIDLIKILPKSTRVCISNKFYNHEIIAIARALPENTQLCIDPTWPFYLAKKIISSLPNQIELYVRNNQCLPFIEHISPMFKPTQTIIINLQMPLLIISAVLNILGSKTRIGFDGNYNLALFQPIVNRLPPQTTLCFSEAQLDKWVSLLSEGTSLVLPKDLSETDIEWLMEALPKGVNLIIPETFPQQFISQLTSRFSSRCRMDNVTHYSYQSVSPRSFFGTATSPRNPSSPVFTASP